MRRAGMPSLLIVSGLLLLMTGERANGQSPAAPSYVAIHQAIDSLNKTLEGPIEGGKEAAPGWATFFGTLKGNLESYAKAGSFTERLEAIGRLQGDLALLATVDWEPARAVHRSLEEWLQPRAQVVQAAESLRQVIGAPASSPEDAVRRKGWVNFIDNYLAGAFKAYETAPTVQARSKAMLQVNEALGALEKAANWQPSLDVATAGRSLLHRPNVDVTADPSSLAKYLARDVVQSGPVTRHGYTSQVTAGPNLGFGLFASDEGIGFYNAQAFTNATPIHDFQQQIASDPRGRRVANLYQFFATTTDAPTLTIMSLITPQGLRLWSNATHAVDAQISSAKLPGHGLQRAFLGLIGMNQSRITQKVYENGIGRMRSDTIREAAEERAERMQAAENTENEKLAKVLVGDKTAVFSHFAITGLDLRSRPEYALASGNFGWHNGPDQLGADHPQPPRFEVLEPGVVADLHVASILGNLTRGVWEFPDVKYVQNILVETKPVKPGDAAGKGVQLKKNASFADFNAAINQARAANDPKAQAIWIRKPKTAPSFGVDARGYLVVIIPDLQIDVAVPAQLAGATNNARILRLQAPMAEIVLDLKVRNGEKTDDPLHFAGAVKEFNPGAGAKVLAINDDETKATPIDPFRAVVILAGFSRAVTSQSINLPLTQAKLPGYAVKNVSSLDPTGWMRIVLIPTPEPVPAPPATAH